MLKRTIDIVLSAIALLLLLPLLVAVGLWIKMESPGPLLFRQERVGRQGRLFRIHKLRTMFFDAEKRGPQLTVGADPRITPAGAFLRKYKLDELPQLVDVLIGNMSLVGPRPEVPRYVALYPPDLRATVLSIRPGITDNASIEFRDESALLATVDDPEGRYINEILPRKLEMYAKYAREHTVLGDLRILIQTIMAVIRL